EFPREMKTVGFYPMVKFPTYGYTTKVEEQSVGLRLTEADYNYWHKMYLLTRTDLPRDEIRALAARPEVRDNPALVDHLLPDTLPFSYLDPYAIDLDDALGHDREAIARDVPAGASAAAT